jgi:choline dehydrogenase-like flavoprotein
MIKYGQDIATGSELSTQVCIVGTGAAGITLAWYLVKTGVKVILIDGSRDFDGRPDKQYDDKLLLYAGEVDGLFTHNEPRFLVLPDYYKGDPSERERYYGGTTVHWGGQSRPLDPIDFEDREGFPGWPITRADLDPYYSEAAAFCKLAGDDFSNDHWANVLEASVPALPGFDVLMYQYLGSQFLNFAKRTVDGQTIGESAAEVIRNASLLDIEHQQGRVNRLRVASIGDGDAPQAATEFTIKADAYVLAAGAVENARLLLLSDAANTYGHVGRNFICHPLTSNVVKFSGSYLTDDESRLLGGLQPDGTRWQDDNGVRVSGRFVPNADQVREGKIGRSWFWASYTSFFFEQASNPDSRILLSDETDPVFGQRRTLADWRFNKVDKQTYDRVTWLFGEAVRARGGSVSFKPWSYIQCNAVINGHHIGTTRMSKAPEDGVVDGNLRTHDLDNLFIAGSSVYPSPGISNPTFTIITLAIRLADHLGTVLGVAGGADSKSLFHAEAQG